MRQLRLPVSIINQQSPPAATFDHHLLLNSCPSPDFPCPKRLLKIYIVDNCDPEKSTRIPPQKMDCHYSIHVHCLNTVYTLPCAIQLSNAIEQICEFANLPSVGIRNIKNEEISLSNTAQYLSFTWLSSLSKVKYIQNTKYVKHKTLITENTAIVR